MLVCLKTFFPSPFEWAFQCLQPLMPIYKRHLFGELWPGFKKLLRVWMLNFIIKDVLIDEKGSLLKVFGLIITPIPRKNATENKKCCS